MPSTLVDDPDTQDQLSDELNPANKRSRSVNVGSEENQDTNDNSRSDDRDERDAGYSNNSPASKAKKSVEENENSASPSDGQTSATGAGERGFLAPNSNLGRNDGVKKKNKLQVYLQTRKRLFFTSIGGSVAMIFIGIFIALPGFVATSIGDMLTNLNDISISNHKRYRRNTVARVSDMFSKDGRRGGRLIEQMQRQGYKFSYSSTDPNQILYIRRPDGTIKQGFQIGEEFEGFMERNSPAFGKKRWKTKGMSALYNRYKVITGASIISPRTTDEAELTDAEVVNKRAAEAVDTSEYDPNVDARAGPDEDAPEEPDTPEAQTEAANKARIAKNNGDFKDLVSFAKKGGDIDQFADQDLVRAWREAAYGVGENLFDYANRILDQRSIANKAFGGVKSIFSATDVVDKVCIINKRMKAAVIAARTFNSLSLMKYAFMYVTASDEVKQGEAQAQLMKHAMRRMIGKDAGGLNLGSSATFSKISRGTYSKSRNDTTRPAYSVDGNITGPLSKLRDKTRVPGCSVWQNPYAQVGFAVGEIALAVFTGGTSTAGTQAVKQGFKVSFTQAVEKVVTRAFLRNLVLGVATEISFEAIMTIGQIYAERSMTANVLGQEQGAMAMDMAGTGMGTAVKQSDLLAGFTPALSTEYAKEVIINAREKEEKLKSQSIFARYFDINNTDSLAFKGATNVAFSGNLDINSINSSAQALIQAPLTFASSLLKIGTKVAGAQEPDEIAFDTHTTDDESERPGLNLAIDQGGNLLPIMREDIENIDPMANRQYLIDTGHITVVDDEDPGTPASQVFKDHISNCVYSLDILSRIESNASVEEGEESVDCLAELTLTKRFKAQLALINYMDMTDADLFPEELNADGSTDIPSPGGDGTTTVTYTGLNGYAIPCEGAQRDVVRAVGGNGSVRADWTGIPTSGSIGITTNNAPINVYIREPCGGQTDIKNIFIASSIHGSENGGQLIAHELLFNKDLPDNVRLIVVPEINNSGIFSQSERPRVNLNGVNLNRNFDYRWSDGSSTQDNYNYRGASPESEPETKALANFIRAIEAEGNSINLSFHYHDIDTTPYVAAAISGSPITFAATYGGISTTTPLRTVEGGTVSQGGSFDAWQRTTFGTPSLLVEMSQDQTEPIINEHVNAVLAILNQGGY